MSLQKSLTACLGRALAVSEENPRRNALRRRRGEYRLTVGGQSC